MMSSTSIRRVVHLTLSTACYGRSRTATIELSMRRQRGIAATREALITPLQARAGVNRFLLSQVGSQFCAGDPQLDVVEGVWRVPIVMITPGFVAGQVGEAAINAETRQIESHTDIDQIHIAADKLRKRHHAAIKTAFLQARKG